MSTCAENTVGHTKHLAKASMNDTSLQPLLRFRAAAIRRSVFLSWILVAILVSIGVGSDKAEDPRLLISAAGFIVVLALATAVNWEQVLSRTVGPWVAWLWAVLMTVGLGTMGSIEGMFSFTQALFAGVVALTGLTLEPIKHAIVAAIAIIALIVAGDYAQVDQILLIIPALTVIVVAFATGLMGLEFERETHRSANRLIELNEQRQDFERLYAVTATLAGAESLSDGLPQIVGTICQYLTAQVGVVFLYHSDDHTLKVMSPMWVNGHTLDVGDLKIPISTGGVVPQVFRSGRPILLDRVPNNADQLGVIGELGLRQAMIAPLKVEGYNVGAIAVGDPIDADFEESQLDILASLAAPAALVLSQLGRYEAASEMTNRMQEIAQMKTDFVSVISHELRTPLTSIIGSLDTINRPGLGPDLTRDLLSSARRQAGRLQRLIEDLLMVSRIDRRSVPVTLESVSLRPFLEEIIATITTDQQVTISVEPSGLQVSADPDHLGRVFINLLENAIKYAADSPVEMTARMVRAQVDIDVVDHGEGIPDDERHRIFDPFTQLERSDTRTKGGTGLGLSIVKGLVEAMDGHISIAETHGGGTTFTVTLQPAGARAAEKLVAS